MIPVGTDLETKKPPKATLIIIAVNIAIFIVTTSLTRNTRILIYDTFAYSPKNLNPLPIFASMFLHNDLFHLLGNMAYLWIFGGPVEERIGHKLFTYYYFIAGLWSTALWGLLEATFNPVNPNSAIGASGAISGIMALFLYRCYYGKLKMALPIVPTFFFIPWLRFNIPAAPLLIFWFLKDLIGGISFLSHETGIAYWGHVGGFLAGIAIGRIKHYGHDAQLERTKAKLLDKIERSFGWKGGTAEKELLKLLDLAPRDPEIHHQLAHYYSENGKPAAAAEHYQQAAFLYQTSDPIAGAYVVIEYFNVLKKPMPIHYHLKAAETLIEKRYLEDAAMALEPVEFSAEGAVGERILYLLFKVNWALDRRDKAESIAEKLVTRYPTTKYKSELQQIRALKPDQVFPKKPEKISAKQKAEQAPAEEIIGENKFLYIMQIINQIVTDPFFIFLWSFLLSWGFGITFKGVVSSFFITFIIISAFRVDWAYHWKMFFSRSEDDARKEVNDTMFYDRAMLAERGENYQKAAELYEKLLASAPTHLQARYNLAKIYHRKLNDLGNALAHFKKLIEHAPPEHPYREEALKIIKNPKRWVPDES